jgi:hypothetical protein
MMAAAAAAAAAAGQSGAAAAAATAFWDQLSGPLPTQAGAAGHRQDGNTGANRRSLRLLSSSGDEQAPSLGEAAVSDGT